MSPSQHAPLPYAGLCFARTDDGVELPVIDLTHAAFALHYTASDLEKLSQNSLKYLQRTARTPRFLLWLMTRRSVLARRSMAARGGFVDGMTTYLYKLGPDALSGKYRSKLDRRIVSQLSPFSVRLRLRAIAQQLADALVPRLCNNTNPLYLLNLGGGVGADSFNAVLLLQAQHADLLAGREIRIVVLDLDHEGPRFGGRAVTALQEPEGPLHGLNIEFQHIEHDWHNCPALTKILAALPENAVVAVSSEGGLFEYGSAPTIVDNLQTLRHSNTCVEVIVGSFAQQTPTTQAMLRVSRAAWNIFDVETIARLLDQGGWCPAQFVSDNPIYHVLVLRQASSSRPECQAKL